MPLLICAAIWYLAITSVLMVGQYYLERHYARGSQRALPPTPLQKLRMRLSGPAAAGRPGPRRGAGAGGAGGWTTPGTRPRRRRRRAVTAEAAPPMVLAEGVHKRFGRLEVLKGIDLTVERGEVMCVIGPSGSGKSTFLRCINHLEQINAGRL